MQKPDWLKKAIKNESEYAHIFNGSFDFNKKKCNGRLGDKQYIRV